LFSLVYVKANSLQVVHGRLFGLPQCKANIWIHLLLGILQTTLQALEDTPSRHLTELAQRLGVNTRQAGELEPIRITVAGPTFAPTKIIGRSVIRIDT
jgi:hypothetical protein